MNNSHYRILPFYFRRFDRHILLTNDVAEYYFLSHYDFDKFVAYQMPKDDAFNNLMSRGFICDGDLAETIDNLADKYRTKKRHLYDFTNLHMMVLTYRCNHNCKYCHASSVTETCQDTPDMSTDVAKRCVDIILQSTAKELKIEFQGGEPLLNYEVLKFVINYAKECNNAGMNKLLEFVVCTNLTLLTPEQLAFFKEHNVVISTSYDGPIDCHDSNRILKDSQYNSSYQKFKEKLTLITDEEQRNSVSVLLTVTRQNIGRLTEVVDDYVDMGFHGIFLRMLNRIGPADNAWDDIGYTVDEFVAAYRETLAYIIDLNCKGIFFPEILATILLNKIMTPFPAGFVDLQSPAGVGIAGVIYDTNGNVFGSDEGRMVARSSGDFTFQIGNVMTDSWRTIFGNSKLREMISDTLIESLPMCCYCVYQPYCGSDPIKNYLANNRVDITCQDMCKKYKAIFDILFEYLNLNNRKVNDVFWTWITSRRIGDSQCISRRQDLT